MAKLSPRREGAPTGESQISPVRSLVRTSGSRSGTGNVVAEFLARRKEDDVIGVLDDDFVDGVAAAEVHLRPGRAAQLLDGADWDLAVTAVTRACQLWGGCADLLVPIVAGAVRGPYQRLLRESELDGVVGAGAPAIAAHPSSRLLLHRAPALLALGTAERERLKELEVCTVRPGDPWELSYLSALGARGCPASRRS